MSIQLEYPEGATPLDLEESSALIPSHISTQGELNEAEQANILKAQRWARGKRHQDALTDIFLRNLHKRMFGNVWKWAGKYRTTGKNIGVPSYQIAIAIRTLCEDASYWIEHGNYTWDEFGARFHHRLVCIHAFPNGNGRHARLMTDVILSLHNEKPFSWGAVTYPNEIGQEGELRAAYLQALREADERRFAKLIQFVRS